MSGWPASSKHIAVVPVVGLDPPAEHALAYAGRLAPRVLAVHVREPQAGRARELEETWARRAPRVPLMILDGSAADWEDAFVKALGALRQTAQAELISVVVPPRSPGGPPGRGPRPTPVAALRLALRRQPGVVFRSPPWMDRQSAPQSCLE